MPHTPETRARDYQKMKDRRALFFDGKQCASCGTIEQLELDHIDPSLKEGHKIWSWTQTKREAELAKCQVLCKACHLVKTKRDLSEMKLRPIQHGTAYAYKRRECRCSACRLAYSVTRKAHYSRTGR